MYTIYRDIKKYLFFSFVWFSFFLSINVNPAEFFFIGLIDKIRLILPSFLTIFFIFLNYDKFKFSNFFQIYAIPFYLIFFSYFFFNLLYDQNIYLNIFWPLQMFLSFFFIHNFTDNQEKEFLLRFTFMIIFFVFFVYFSASTIQMYLNENMHFYGITGGKEGYLGLDSPPRSSGLARMSLILFSCILILYITKNYNRNYPILILLSFFGFATIVYQSRTISFIYFFIITTISILHFKKFFYDKLLILFALILPLILNTTYHLIKDIKYDQINTADIFSEKGIYIMKDSIIRDQVTYKKNRYVLEMEQLKFLFDNQFINEDEYEILVSQLNIKKLNRFSSDRFANWKKIYDKIKNNPLKGYGAQSDRILLNNQSIHNYVAYTSISGGLISFLAAISIYLISTFMLIKVFFVKKNYHGYNFYALSSAYLLIILMLRSLLETSFGIFSIDFLIFIIAISYLKSFLNKTKITN